MERDRSDLQLVGFLRISIHALRMERDNAVADRFAEGRDFNPRAPHGARQQKTTNHIRNYVDFYNNKNINLERKLF